MSVCIVQGERAGGLNPPGPSKFVNRFAPFFFTQGVDALPPPLPGVQLAKMASRERDGAKGNIWIAALSKGNSSILAKKTTSEKWQSRYYRDWDRYKQSDGPLFRDATADSHG